MSFLCCTVGYTCEHYWWTVYGKLKEIGLQWALGPYRVRTIIIHKTAPHPQVSTVGLLKSQTKGLIQGPNNSGLATCPKTQTEKVMVKTRKEV